MKNLLLAVGALAVGGCFLLTGQDSPPPAVYSDAQAAAGRTAYASTCGKCHLDSLMGRTGDPCELPAVDSLPAVTQDVVRGAGGIVPPLAGADFMKVWGARTTMDLAFRVQTAVGGFPPQDKDKTTYLNLTAYFLQANGAPAGTKALAAATAVEIRSLQPAKH
jgi:hypothetical protein